MATRKNNSERVLHVIEQQSQQIFLPIVGRKKGNFLESLVAKQQPSTILEIGTLVGYSAILMARSLERGRIISVEISPHSAEIAHKNISEAGFSDKVKILVGDALHIIPRLKETFNLVFIDAAKEEYLAYLKLLEKNNLKKGTIIVADNAKIFADAMRDYLHYVRESGNYKSKFYDFGDDGMEVSIKL